MAETREVSKRPFLSKVWEGGRSSGFRSWFSENWTIAAMLLIIFFLAFFVRAYYGYPIASENGYPVSGGSDSYYWQRIIDYSATTGKQLYWDPMTDYPDGIRNPRPPMFSMAIVVPSVIIQGAFDNVQDAWGWTLMWTPAFWGALTVIPLYFIGKETFGRRVGLVAAFFLAVTPNHIQRSVISEADHDAFILFLIVVTFFFLLKAIKAQQHKTWVQNWRSWPDIKSGFKDYFANSKTAILFSLMAGTAFGAVIMTWVGFGYAAVIILVFYIIQVLINKFRNVDSLGVTMVVAISLGFGYLLSFPVYYCQSLIPVRFDVPVYLWAASLLFGLLFVVSRNYPWTLSLPVIFTVLLIGVLIVNIFDPELAEAILSGQGYFATNKLYSTIAEARAPAFSELAMGFGMVTFFIAFVGLGWAIVQIPKHNVPDYIFLVVWLGASIFMAVSAGRFMFNAAPAFALAAAWVLVLVVDRIDFMAARKSVMGASGSYLRVIRKSVKIRHVVGALFLAFLIILPNVWYSVDAGIPSESKSELDKDIYFSMPEFLRPADYDEYNGSNWYLGAFGYTIPLPSYYFPAAWEWFSETDSDIFPETSRPAFVAWWDYGFEAIQAGKHPTVADNFQNEYQLTGNIIVGQGELNTVSAFTYRIISCGLLRPEFTDGIYSLMAQYNISAEEMDKILYGPTAPLVDEILTNPHIYGPFASDMSPQNARIIAGNYLISQIGLENIVALYGQLCDLTGWDIRYFMVDSRMLPKSGSDTGIFYAPAKLSDRRIVEGSIPIDYYNIRAVDQYGTEHDLDDVSSDMVIVDYAIKYKPMFYNSTFYRAMCGFAPSDIGFEDDGLPGYSGTVQGYTAAPGWNMTHFRMVYRTAYFNPWPSSEVWKHRDAWTAISFDEATELKAKIQNGEMQGTVDDSVSSYYSAGAVFLKYYAGAFVNGTLTTEQGYPVSGMHVTIKDEYGIPHQSTLTDAEGRYSLLAPFGNVTLVFSEGSIKNVDLTGSDVIEELQFNVTDDQAMRVHQDLDGDGVHDYEITKDFVMKGTETTGDIFWDMNTDGNYTEGTDMLIPDTRVFATELNTNVTYSIDASEGSFDTVLAPGRYRFRAVVNYVNLTMAEQTNITAGVKSTQKLAIKPAEISGTLIRPDGSGAGGVELTIRDAWSPYTVTQTTDASGNFSFSPLVYGGYTLSTTEPGSVVFNELFGMEEGQKVDKDIILYPASQLTASVYLGSSAATYAVFSISNNYDRTIVQTGQTDQFGTIDMALPKGSWTLYLVHNTGSMMYSSAVLIDASVVDSVQVTVSLLPAIKVEGTLKTTVGASVYLEYLTFESSSGARVSAKTDSSGAFDLMLPAGVYQVTCLNSNGKRYLSDTITVTETSHTFDLRTSEGYAASGTIYLDGDAVDGVSDQDLGRLARIRITDIYGRVLTTTATINGTFLFSVPQLSAVTISVGDPGYSSWNYSMQLTKDSKDLILVATPDKVLVTGQVTLSGTELRGVQVGFLPDSMLLTPVYVTSGADGLYSAYLPPAAYTPTVVQDTNPMGGERYLFDGELTEYSPSVEGYMLDVPVQVKVEMYGYILGGGSQTTLKLDGPDQVELLLTTLNYSVFVTPGMYSVYASSSIGSVVYADMDTALVQYDSRNHDLTLMRAYELTGVITIDSSPPGKQVSVTATSQTGESVTVKSSSQGYYSVRLPQGTYSVDYLLETTVTEDSRTHYIEYYDVQTVEISSGRVVVDSALAMRWDNSTLSGTVYGPESVSKVALIQLFANTKYGENASFYTSASGQFSVGVQPGDYTMYVSRLQDKKVSMSTITITRNTPSAQDISLTDGKYLSGRTLVSGVGKPLDVSVANGSAKLHVMSGSAGEFSLLVPSANYTLAASTSQTENAVKIDYSGSEKVVVGDFDVYTDFELTRGTRQGVTTLWNRSQTQTVLPGVTVTYTFTVTNTGNIQDSYLITFTGSGFNVTFSAPELVVDFGTNNEATVMAEVTAQDSLAAGDTKVSCLVRSKTSPSTRSNLDLYLNVSKSYGVQILTLNVSEPVSTLTSYTKFRVSNLGNVQDTFQVSISNLDSLESLGWKAEIVDPTTKAVTSKVNASSHGSADLMVKFTSIRSDADPEAKASVLAVSQTSPGVSSYGAIQVMLPELVIGPDGLDAERSDLSYSLDANDLYINIGLIVAIAVLVAMFFYLRKKRGISSAPAKGGAKK